MNYEDVLRYHIDRGCDITRVCHRGESLNMFVLKTSLLLDLIADQQRYQSIVDVVNDMKSGLTICDYEYDGYVATIDSVERYFYHSLQLLDPNVWKQLFVKTSPIYTKVKDEPPTKYTAKATVKNAMIANGCIIDGTIEKSILFRAVKIGENTVVKNSVVMQKSQIGEGCYLENVIIDKDVRIGDGIQLIGTETHPVVIRKGTIQGALMKS